jgi:hypothetical protein
VNVFIENNKNSTKLDFKNIINGNMINEYNIIKQSIANEFEKKYLKGIDGLIERYVNIAKNLEYAKKIQVDKLANEKIFYKFELDILDLKGQKVNSFIKDIEKFNELNLNIAFIRWNKLSYGERAYLNLFSRINKILITRKKGLLRIMIDEGEVGFHPEWQRNFIQYLMEYFHSFDLKFEIFISTHSPLVITDIPKENILFLPKAKDKVKEVESQTFAQNIHTILYDGFFLTNTLGEFAKKKIEELVDAINIGNPMMNKDEIWKRIQVIGEPIIRKKLEELFRDKFQKHKSRKERIKELEEELEILKVEDNNDSD